MINQTIIKGKYRPEIDGLRAFAVVAVIINHFNKDILPSGYLGVDIFFVISGYVITSSLAGRKSKNFWDFISGFYERRVKRLIPSLVIFVLTTGFLICCFNDYPIISLRTGIASLFGLSNLYLLKNSTDYFAQSTDLNVFAHTWSLGVEEQFYFLFPFLIWFTGFGRQETKGSRNLFISVLFLVSCSLISFIYLYSINQSAAYFLMPARFWEMATGCLVFLCLQKRGLIIEKLEKTSPLFVLTAMFGVMFLPISAAVPSTISIVLLSALLIACIREGTLVFKIFTHENIIYIGLISYSLYLWHWGILSISRWTIGIHWWSIPFQIGLMFLLAVSSYKWVETPLRKEEWFDNRGKTLLSGVGILSVSALSIAGLAKPPATSFLQSIGIKLFPYAYKIPKIPQKEFYCHLPGDIDRSFADCLSEGNLTFSRTNIFLVGDSHASNHHWSIQAAIEKNKSKAKLHTLVEYGFIKSLIGEDSCHDSKICIKNAWSKYLEFFSNNLNEGDYIFISTSRDRFVQGLFNALPRGPKNKELANLKSRLIALASIADKKDAYILLIDDIPKVCRDDINYSHEIVRMGNIKSCTITKSISIQDRKDLTNVFLSVKDTNDNVSYVDPHNYLCTDKTCSVIDNQNSLLYSDKSPHFTFDSKIYLTGFWEHHLKKLNVIQN